MSASALEQQIHDWLRQHALFSIVDDADLADLVHELEMSSHVMGQTIVQEGTPGDAVYLVYAGKVRVFKDGPLGKPVTLATLGPGEIFGEHAALSDEPRSASVRTAEDSVLLRLPRSAFAALLERQPVLRPHLEKLARFRAFGRFLQHATFLGAVPARQLVVLLDQFEDCTFQEGETIFHEGELGDRLFIVKTGAVKVVKHDIDQETVLAYLGAGDYFGERALVLREPRYASVVALDRTECASLSRSGFERLQAAAPQVCEQLRRRLEQHRPAEELARRVGMPRPARADIEAPRRLIFESITGLIPLPGPPRRRAWVGRAFPFVAQDRETDCGIAALAMIARYHGVRLSLEALRYLAHVGNAGASMLALKEAAEAVGFECRAVQTDFSHLADLSLPAIAHWKGYHYLALYEVRADQVVLGDPAEGLVRKSRQVFVEGWTGSLILLSPTPRLGQVACVPSPWECARHLLPSSPGTAVGLLLVNAVAAVLVLIIPLLLGQWLDNVIGLADAHDRANPLIIGLLFTGLGLTMTLIMRRLLLKSLCARLAVRLNGLALQRVLGWPFPFSQTRPAGAWLAQLDVGRLLSGQETVTMMIAFLNGLVALGGVSLVFFWDPFAGLMLATLMLLGGLLALVGRTRLRVLAQQRANHDAGLSSFLVETVQALPALWGTRAEHPRLKRYQEQLQSKKSLEDSSRRRQGLRIVGSWGILCLAAALAAWHVSEAVIGGRWSAGQALALLCYVGLSLMSFGRLLALIPETVQWVQRWRQASELLATALPEATPSRDQPLGRGFLRLADVSYRPHPESPDILAHLDLEISPGRIAWIVGSSGAGKSTLVRLLQRRYRPSQGKILLDGIDLQALNKQVWQAFCSVVPQEPMLIAGTIRDNIVLEHPDSSMEQVLTAGKLAGAHDFILRLPGGYEHVVAPEAMHLSTGQKQALCLARALVSNPRLLILDEATVLLGADMEEQVLRNLRALAGDRTILIFTQRPFRVEVGDLLVLLEDGQIVAKNTKDAEVSGMRS